MVEFPDDLRRFIERYIDSLAELETLLLLGGRPGDEWSAEAVAEAMYTNAHSAMTNLRSLKAKGLLEERARPEDPRFCFRLSGEAAPLIDRLSRLYSGWRVKVATLIYSKPDPGLKAFKDAFDFRKPRED